MSRQPRASRKSPARQRKIDRDLSPIDAQRAFSIAMPHVRQHQFNSDAWSSSFRLAFQLFAEMDDLFQAHHEVLCEIQEKIGNRLFNRYELTESAVRGRYVQAAYLLGIVTAASGKVDQKDGVR